MKKLLLLLALAPLISHGQSLRSLATARGFTFGCGDTDPSIFNSDSTFNSLVAAQCNSIEPGNVMKQNAMEPSNGSYDFSQADLVMNYAATNSQTVTATAPVWDNASYGGGTPSWVSGLSSGALTTALQNYVAQFMNHMHTNYPGRMKQIALVSEASHQCPSAGYNPGFGTGPYCSILGLDSSSASFAGHVGSGVLFPTYVRLAFAQARASDPSAHLCYDDWGWEGSGGSGSSNYQYWMVAWLKSLGLVDCVGLEGQWQFNTIPTNVPSISSIASTISAYQSLGVTVYFSQVELGINTNGTTNNVPNSYTSTVPADLTTQANLYSQLVNSCLGNSACNAFYVWGISDKWAFIDAPSFHVGAPQPYDASYNPKSAFTAIQTALASGGGGCNASATASTPDPNTWQAAINTLTCATSTLTIPSGTITQTAGATLTVPSAITNLTVQGATVITCSGTAGQTGYACPATDNTVIIDSFVSNNPLITLNLSSSASAVFRMTGITIKGGNAGSGGSKFNGWINVNSGVSQVRLDHNHFNEETYSPAITGVVFRNFTPITGVADHNLLDLATTNSVYPFGFSDFGAYGDTIGNGDGTFNTPTPWGQLTPFVVESNVQNGGVINDCGNAGSMVIRYNNINDASVAIQTHGTKSPAGPERGCRSIEMYGNYFTGPGGGGQQSAAVGTKGTAALIWGNNMASGFFRFYQGGGDRQSGDEVETNTPNGWGYCGTTVNGNGVGSAWDGNTNAGTGYPCLDGLGRGQTPQSLNGANFPGRLNSSTGSIHWPNQYLEPQYLWLNTLYSGASAYMLLSDLSVNNQDYFYDCGTWNSSCSSFTGAAGTGSGTLAARPATCTAGAGGTYLTSPTGSYGAAYWATDANSGRGELYVCDSTNHWSAIYEPAVFPHPLVSGTPQAATPTFAPGSGTYTPPQSIVVSTTTPAATIHYTVDGTTPTTSSPTYSTPLTFSGNTVLQAIAVAGGFLQSPVGSATYTFTTPTCAAPTQLGPNFSNTYQNPPPSGATYTFPLAIGFSSSTAGCAMHMTLDSSTPNCSSAAYAGQNINATTTMRVIACQSGFVSSGVVGGTWTITNAANLTVSAAGTGSGSIGGTNCPTGVSAPTVGSSVACTATPTAGAVVTSSGTGSASGCSGSTCSFTFSATSTLTYSFAALLPVPVFSPLAGTYSTPQSVTLTDPGAVICYTVDASTPTTNGAGTCVHGTTYSGPISVSTTTQIIAIATKAGGYTDSAIGSATYTINLIFPPKLTGAVKLLGQLSIIP